LDPQGRLRLCHAILWVMYVVQILFGNVCV
jgi:hypothetical protein